MRVEDGLRGSHLWYRETLSRHQGDSCCIAQLEADMCQGSSWRHECSSSSSAIGSVCWNGRGKTRRAGFVFGLTGRIVFSKDGS